MPAAIDMQDLKDLKKEETFFGAIAAWRGTGPRPTVTRAFFYSSTRRRYFIVARGPVPRDHWGDRSMARETRSDARVASEGPSPTVMRAFLFVNAGAFFSP